MTPRASAQNLPTQTCPKTGLRDAATLPNAANYPCHAARSNANDCNSCKKILSTAILPHADDDPCHRTRTDSTNANSCKKKIPGTAILPHALNGAYRTKQTDATNCNLCKKDFLGASAASTCSVMMIDRKTLLAVANRIDPRRTVALVLNATST
jgi:hypothetical protein